MGNTKAVGRRARVLRRANDRAQRRFHEACKGNRIFDEQDPATRLYVEAERLVDDIMAPEEHELPVVDLEEILRALAYERNAPALAGYTDRLDEYQTRGA